MRGFPCKNISCGLDSTMCLDHDQVTGAAVPTNPALAADRAPAALPVSPAMHARIAAWRAAKEGKAS